jgi:hypothetical protein
MRNERQATPALQIGLVLELTSLDLSGQTFTFVFSFAPVIWFLDQRPRGKVTGHFLTALSAHLDRLHIRRGLRQQCRASNNAFGFRRVRVRERVCIAVLPASLSLSRTPEAGRSAKIGTPSRFPIMPARFPLTPHTYRHSSPPLPPPISSPSRRPLLLRHRKHDLDPALPRRQQHPSCCQIQPRLHVGGGQALRARGRDKQRYRPLILSSSLLSVRKMHVRVELNLF